MECYYRKVILLIFLLSLSHVVLDQCIAFSVMHQSVYFMPSGVEFTNVCKKYPLTWQRKFLSSVPIREYALQNVSLVLDSHQIIMFQGASACGKSTLLKAILEPNEITSGHVAFTSSSPPRNTACINNTTAKPIYLDQRPLKSSRRTVYQELYETSRVQMSHTRKATVDRLSNILGFSKHNANWLQQRISDLPASEFYRFCILLACLQSCGADSAADANDGSLVVLPAPILLLDEWMDTETSIVIRATQDSLRNLVCQTGALVCVVTHKGGRWEPAWINRTITLSGGKLLHWK